MNSAMLLDRQQFIDGLADWAEDPPLTLVLSDIDGFATFNETNGAEAGDQVIALVQRALKGSLPTGSYLARLGGDEFGCALPGTTPEEALIVLEEIRQHLDDRRHPVKGKPESVSMSFGIAAYPQHVAR